METDVARLKHKVADLHVQLNQQRQHGEGSSEKSQRVKSLQAQQ